MHRSAYSNGHAAYPLGGSGAYNFSQHKFQPRSQPALRRRRQLVLKLSLAALACLSLVFIFSPSARAGVLGVVSLGLYSAAEDSQLETVRYYDLSNVQGSARGWEREERILLCAPLRDAAPHLPMFFSHLRNLTYPHNLIDLAFLVGDSKDNTRQLLNDLLEDLQAHDNPRQRYGEISIMNKDFGQKVNQDVESRHGFAAQAGRRKSMAQARNWLLSAAMRPTHSWVYWRDVDVETAPFTILEDLMRHNKDVIVPNVWRPLPDWLGGEQPYDLNSWQESETALALADTLEEDAVIVEGYAEYATWRPHLAYLRDPYGDPDMEMELDGVGGVSILAKAKVFRAGVHFPAFSFEKHAETEGFGKASSTAAPQDGRDANFATDGEAHEILRSWPPSLYYLAFERKEKAAKEKEEKDRMEKIKSQFDSPKEQWQKDKAIIKDEAKKEYAESEVEKAKKQAASSPPGDNAPAAEKKQAAPKKGRVSNPVGEVKVAGKKIGQ
ncbi:glycosyltransferase family 62 protein [Venturia nashicola]|nr:glycosyltransferase family 62 protein [Venturia nashicola]